MTNDEVIERLQEKVITVDKLKEVHVLEKRLREVRDLEERLQEVDEMAERLQEVIEEELGKEEVAKLREEEEKLEQEEVKGITKTVVKKSVRMQTKTESEVDELEDEIKRVFLKDLLPEEEEGETKVKQESVKEVTDVSVLDDSLRDKLRLIEKEWRDEMEQKFDSTDFISDTSVVTYKKVERRIKKKVTIVDDRGQQEEDMENMQMQSEVISKERLGEEKIWRKTEILEERTEREVVERFQAEDQSQVEKEDIWFILFDRSPYKAVVKPSGTVCHCASSLHVPLVKKVISLKLPLQLLFSKSDNLIINTTSRCPLAYLTMSFSTSMFKNYFSLL